MYFMLMLVVLLALPFAVIAALILAARFEARRHAWQFRISDVFSRAFSTITRAPVAILATSLVFSALPSLVLQLLFGLSPGNALFAMTGTQTATAIALGTLAGLLIGTLGEVTMIGIALDVLAGRPAKPGAALAQGLRLLLPAIVARLLWWIGVTVGLMLVVIPGLVLMLTWAVVLPVLVAERPGIFASFRRSGELVVGARWRLLLLGAMVLVLWAIFGGMAQGFLLGSVTGAAHAGSLVFQTAITTLSGALTATGLSAIYHQLKSEREGLMGQDLEAVFA
ncbi:hypothetical protein ACBY01_10815 [Sphingomonas sp. ac-8]|uniref:hypothetical protein n=1 Tax=Sphingomonas sp. ac-8 TaxID=3242977 RepID=UPI003A8035DA